MGQLPGDQGPLTGAGYFEGFSGKRGSGYVRERTDQISKSDHLVSLVLHVQVCMTNGRSKQSPGDQIMNKNQVEGRASEAKGKAKEAAGKVTDDKSTEYKGKAEKHAGKAEAKYGDIKSDVRKDAR